MKVRVVVRAIIRPISGPIRIGLLAVVATSALIGLVAWHWSTRYENNGEESSYSLPPSHLVPGDRDPLPMAVADSQTIADYPEWFVPHPPRQLIVSVDVAEISAKSARWRATYTLRIAPADPLVVEFREGAWADGPNEMMTSLLGVLKVYPSDKTTDYASYTGPRVRVNSATGVLTATWETSDDDLAMTTATVAVASYEIPFQPMPVESAELVVAGTGFTIAGLRPPYSVIGQSERRVDLPVGALARTRVALLQDGYSTSRSEITQTLTEVNHDGSLSGPVENPIDDDWLILLLASAAPWLLVLSASIRRGTLAAWTRVLAAVTLPVIVVASLVAQSDDDVLGPLVGAAILIPLIMLLGRPSGPGIRRWRWYHSVAAVASAAGWSAWLILSGEYRGAWETWLTVAVVYLAGVAVAGRTAGAPAAGRVAAAGTLAVVAAVATDGADGSGLTASGVTAVVYIVAWLLAAILTFGQMRGYGFRVPFAVAFSAAFLALFGAVPVPDTGVLLRYDARSASVGAVLLLGPLLVELLRRRGADSRAVADPATRAYAVALAVLPLVNPPRDVHDLVGDWSLLVSAAVLVGGLFWVMPDELKKLATVLGRLSPAAHTALMRRQLLRRTALVAARSRYQASTTGDVDTADIECRRRAVEDAERQFRLPGAMAGGGGHTPWENGLAGARYALTLVLPVMITCSAYAVVTSGSSLYSDAIDSPLDAAVDVLFWGRWAIYGFIFGYFYPRLRGREPMTKALPFATVILLAETIGVFGGLSRNDVPAVVEAVGTIVAPGVILAVGLGLLWERRLAAEAGFPWRWVRAWNSLRGFTTPVVSIAVAVVSSAGSSVIGALLSRVGKS